MSENRARGPVMGGHRGRGMHSGEKAKNFKGAMKRLFRYMERKLNNRFTCHDIISQLREMNFLKIPNQGYVPAYTRTDFTDALHEAFGFRTDYEIVTEKEMKRIMRSTKK